MIETHNFGRLIATVDHNRRIITLTLQPVRNPVCDARKLEQWARASLSENQDYELLRTYESENEPEKQP